MELSVKLPAKTLSDLGQSQKQFQALGQLCHLAVVCNKPNPVMQEEDILTELRAQLRKYILSRCSANCDGVGCPNNHIADSLDTMPFTQAYGMTVMILHTEGVL